MHQIGFMDSAAVKLTDLEEEGELEEGEFVMDTDEAVEEKGETEVTLKVEEPPEDFTAYRKKFGTYERFPSPTPSDDYRGVDADVDHCSGKISRFSNHVNSDVSPASNIIGAVQRPSADTATSAVVSYHINSNIRALSRRRDPRRRYAELNLPPPVTVEAPSGSSTECKSNVNITFEGSNQGGPASKRQRTGLLDTVPVSWRERNTKVGIQLKPLDPRRVLFNGNVPLHCSAEVETNKNVKDRVPEGDAKMKRVPPHVTALDTTRQHIENPKDADTMTPSLLDYFSSEASQVQSSASTIAEQRTDACSTSEDSVTHLFEHRTYGFSKSRTTWNDVKHLFDEYDDHHIAQILKERERRFEEQKKMFAEHKLCLVLDLDHTLLNSTKFSEIDPVHEEMLRWKEEQEKEKPDKHLFRLPHIALWTKLRPGIWNFLEKACKLCELHVCTMGNKLYATEMAKILDPKGVLFAGRVISRGDDGEGTNGDDRVSKTKDLEGVLGMESSIVIMDDCKRVWPHNGANLIAVERYIYFPCSRRQFGLGSPSLLEIDHDERLDDGALASSLAVIERLHKTFFSHRDLYDADVRVILAEEQRKILSGCQIVFSHVFPLAEVNPHLHPLWKLAEQLGASCTNRVDEKVTHVVANSPGTDKVKWALSTGRFVVRPNWVEASALLNRRAKEQDFSITLLKIKPE